MIDPRSVRALLTMLLDELLDWVARKAIGNALDRGLSLPAPTEEGTRATGSKTDAAPA